MAIYKKYNWKELAAWYDRSLSTDKYFVHELAYWRKTMWGKHLLPIQGANPSDYFLVSDLFQALFEYFCKIMHRDVHMQQSQYITKLLLVISSFTSKWLEGISDRDISKIIYYSCKIKAPTINAIMFHRIYLT